MGKQLDNNKEYAIRASKGLIALIPIAGGVINAVWSDYQSGRKFKRLKEFIDGLKTNIVKLESNFK